MILKCAGEGEGPASTTRLLEALVSVEQTVKAGFLEILEMIYEWKYKRKA